MRNPKLHRPAWRRFFPLQSHIVTSRDEPSACSKLITSARLRGSRGFVVQKLPMFRDFIIEGYLQVLLFTGSTKHRMEL